MEYRQREIIPVGAFPFDIALDYLRTWTAATFEIISDDHYRRALRVNGQDVLLELTRGDAGHLTLAVTGAAVTGSLSFESTISCIGAVFEEGEDGNSLGS